MTLPFTRLWEILRGTPHIRQNSAMVKQATDSLARKTQELETVVRPYSEAPDPLTALMCDLYEQRRQHANVKLHS